MSSLKDKMKPRQRCAIANPIVCDQSVPHARHLKRNGYVQSILTFDVDRPESLDGMDDSVIEKSLNGWIGVWHARVSMFPIRHVDTWPNPTIKNAKGVLERLLQGVGLDEDVEVHNGSDLHSVHVYKWATHDEIRLAEEELRASGTSFALKKLSVAIGYKE